jgi:hypothetical protein
MNSPYGSLEVTADLESVLIARVFFAKLKFKYSEFLPSLTD